jgi:hypothetical protein
VHPLATWPGIAACTTRWAKHATIGEVRAKESDRPTRAPPDDTGTDTLRRYRYQAKVVFPYVLHCAMDGPIEAVIPEHIEDLALQYPDCWRFVQIKSRDAGRGSWSLSDLLDKDGGALRSLYRAFKTTRDVKATYELFLEHPVSSSNPVGKLVKLKPEERTKLVARLAKDLTIAKDDAAAFLGRVRLANPLPGRDHIDAVNLRLLQAQRGDLTYDVATTIYENVLNRIEAGMRAERPKVPWPDYAALPPEDRSEEIFEAKCLGRQVCQGLFEGLHADASPLLKRSLDPNLPRPTNLESKLMLGGATDAIVDSAIRLRARAALMSFETVGGGTSLGAMSRFEDLRERLFLRTTAIVEKHRGKASAAVEIWNDLMTATAAEAEKLDPNNVANRDQMALVGHVCELSDECRTDWGGPNAS